MNSNQFKMLNSTNTTHSIRGRLIIGFSTIVAFLLIAITVILYKISSIESFSESVVNTEIPAYEMISDLNIKINQTQNSLVTWIITHDPQEKNIFNSSWNLINDLEIKLDYYYENIQDKVSARTWQDLKSLLATLKLNQDKIINNTTFQNSTELSQNVIPIKNKILDIIDGPLTANSDRSGGLFDIQSTLLNHHSQQILSDLSTIRYIEYTLLVLTLLLSVFISYYTSRGIINYINIFRLHSAKVASGDLTQRIHIESKDEMGQLGDDLNKMTESLATITKQITESCHNMVSSITEVKHVVDVQSSGASEQASSINEITASLEEIEKSSTQTIEKAKALGEVAERTREKGQMGLNAVEQSVSGMKSVREKVEAIAQTILDLSNQTQQVGEITAVVNTLAQQSKMLALNASIEAAKAGDAGKGFAVVASEVKNLAEQSEQATTQVQKILEDIRRATEKAVMATEEGTKGVDLGTKLVEETGDVVRSLSDVIHEATIASQQIEAAIRQEGIGIEQITAGMNEINQVTASFVDSVKQTTEAISNLAEMVRSMKEYIEVYKL